MEIQWPCHAPLERPPRAQALTGKGLALLDLGRLEAAVGAFDAALARDPAHAAAWAGRGEVRTEEIHESAYSLAV